MTTDHSHSRPPRSASSRMLLVAGGQIHLHGYLPAAWGGRARGVLVQIGRRTCPGKLHSGGKYTVSFHSRKLLLRVTVWARLDNASLVRVRSHLVLNRGGGHSRAMLDEAADQFAQRPYLDIPEQPCERSLDAAQASLLINWIIPDFRQGNGGHATIFRFAAFLKDRGHRNVFWIIGDCRHQDPSAYIDRHFQPLQSPVHRLAPDQVDQIVGDVVVATNCWTAYYARGVGHVGRKCYLVQDYEPWFYPMGMDYHCARRTYGFGFQIIAAGHWLVEMMRREGVESAATFSFGYERRHYFPATPPEPAAAKSVYHISFYARISTERRMVLLGLQALEILSRQRSDFMVHFFGQSAGGRELPYAWLDEGVLTDAELGRLYRECDVGLVFSATNHSVVPTEMMACGLPVVEIDGENNRLSYPDDSITLAEPVPESVAAVLARLLDSPAEREARRAAGLRHAAGLSWDTAGHTIEATLRGDLSE